MTTYCILNESGVVITTFANPQLPPTQPGYTEIPVDAGQVGQVWNGSAFVASVPTLEQQRSALLALLEPQRLEVLTAGMSYRFPDGTEGVIQTRNPTLYPDILNVASYATLAQATQSTAATMMPVGFIDAANVEHPMTPAEAIAMGVAVATFVSATYTAKQAIRTQIKALTAETVATFDITQGWPA